MGINDRDYMRDQDTESARMRRSTYTRGLVLGLGLIVVVTLIGRVIQSDRSEQQQGGHEIDLDRREARLLHQSDRSAWPQSFEEIDSEMRETRLSPLDGPPASIKRQININTASVEELDTLPYVGQTTAQSIITHRPYKMIEDLEKVRGISKRRIEEIKPYITVGDPE